MSVARWWIFDAIMGRLLLASLILMPALLVLGGFGLDAAFQRSLLSAEKSRLTAQVYLLLSAAEVEEGSLWLPKVLAEPQFSQPNSGLYGFVHADNNNQLDSEQELWRSTSAQWLLASQLGLQKGVALRADVVDFGQYQQLRDMVAGKQDIYYGVESDGYFYLRYRVQWELENNKAMPLVFSVYQSRSGYLQQLASFRQSLWRWFGLVVASMVSLQFVFLLWGLRPLRQLTRAIARLNSGDSHRLQGKFARELRGLADNLNQLLEREHQQRERYRNTLADLAHSLKTPLAIAANEINSAQQESVDRSLLIEQLSRMNDIVARQLQRAQASGATLQPKQMLAPIIQRLCNSLKKLFTSVVFELKIAEQSVAIDEKDLFEMLGNVMENACKYGATKVAITSVIESRAAGRWLQISIADNGPGIAQQERQRLMARGQRLDESKPGQGLGMALVQDILIAYGGELRIEDSVLGGVSVCLLLPLKV